MSFKDISYLELIALEALLACGKSFVQFYRGYHGDHYSDIILNLDQWFLRRCQKIHFYQEFWWPLCSLEGNHLCNFGRRHHEEQFCEIILNMDQEMLFKGISNLELWQPICSGEWNYLCNFGRGYHKVQFCEIILNWTSGSGDVNY